MTTDQFFGTKEVDGVTIVVFRQAQILDAVTIERLSAGLKDLLDGAESKQFIFDFSQVNYLSSSALGMLIGLQRRVVQPGGSLKLSGIREDIMEVFRITKLDTVFDIYRDIPSALEAFRGKR